MSDLLKIGVSGVNANQAALSTTGHNITSANVEGYSRQTVSIGTQLSVANAAGFIGSGASVQTVERVSDQFLVERLRADTSTFNSFDAYLFNAEQVDSLLADPATGLASSMESFFASLQQASDDPSSIPVRELVISEAENLATRFNLVGEQLNAQNEAMNENFESMAEQINSLAGGIATLNQTIVEAAGRSGGQPPNDLLDERDELLRQLSELVNVSTTSQSEYQVNVFIGNGQPLVLGNEANKVVTVDGEENRNQKEFAFFTGSDFQVISDDLSGGEIGGLLQYREEQLNPAINSVGQLALGIADTINDQQLLGVDSEGNYGSLLFTDINDPVAAQERVTGHPDNALPADRNVTVTIEDVSQITTSDYELEFVGPSDRNYTLTRKSDGEVVQQGVLNGIYPAEIEGVDGFTIELNSGSFQFGDVFNIQPTATAATTIGVEMTRPQELAFSFPIQTEANQSNLGTGAISSGQVFDIYQADGSLLDNFTADGGLNPPLVIVFDSPNTYSVLDASDPLNPVPLEPPISYRPFAPASSNTVFSDDPNAQRLQSQGAVTTTLVPPAAGLTDNGYPGEAMEFRVTDPTTGVTSVHNLDLDPNETAQESAAKLTEIDGVNAFASTQMSFTVSDDGAGSLMNVSLNGIDLTNIAQGEVPNPLTADYLAERINLMPELEGSGVIAVSDGTTVNVVSTVGDDLQLEVTGGDVGSDQLDITAMNDAAVAGTVAVGQSSVIGGRVEMDIDGGVIVSSTEAVVGAGGLFIDSPSPVDNYFGFQVSVDGRPQAGDEFSIDYNGDAISDNRNALAMVALQSANLIDNGSVNFEDSYARLVEEVGSQTNEARINQEASQSLLQQATAARESVSGVNLDEEAARLIQFEQAYNASAQVISVARDLFDTLLNSVG